jgi:hypothetical protein
MADIDPNVLHMLAQGMGGPPSPEMMKGFMAALAAKEMSKIVRPPKVRNPNAPPEQQVPPGQAVNPGGPPGAPPGKPKAPPAPQAGGQVHLNKLVPGPGPIRSNTGADQLRRLAEILSMPGMIEQLLNMPQVPPHMRAGPPGIPNIPGPKLAV